MTQGHQHHGGLVWPLILIGAGVVLLLNNLGILAWGVWETLWRLWPVLLIAIGLEILIGRRSIWGSLAVAVSLLVVIGLAVGLGLPHGELSGAGTVDRTETISEELKGAARTEVEIGFGTGTLNLAALPAGSPQLIRGTLDLSKGEGLQRDHSGAGSVERFVLESQGTWSVGFSAPPDERKTWDLELNRDVPIDLKVRTGVGRSSLDLTQLNLTRLEVNGGVGQVTAKLPERGRFDVKIDGGVGEITLIIPQGLAARVRVDGGLGGIRVEGDFVQRDREYESRLYSTAENRADIQVDGGIGRIIVREIVE